MYKTLIDPITGATSTRMILRVSDGAFIPMDARNDDYIAYLDWLSKGNTPSPA